jgi:heme exporter protein C
MNVNAKSSFRLLSPTAWALFVLALVGFLVAPQWIVSAPNEPTMGLVQRIFYYHVPCAWQTMFGAFLAGGAGALYLFKGSARAERIAQAAAELAVLFGLCVLITGPLWARKAWGVWWQWDVRLTTTALLWVIFLAGLFAKKYGGPGSARLSAGLFLFGAADVPMIYISVSLWRTIHPKTSVVRTLDPAMAGALWMSVLAFTLLFALLLLQRYRFLSVKARLSEAILRAEDAGLLDE